MKKNIIKIIVLSILVVLVIIQFFQKLIFTTASDLDLSYSRSINSWGETWRRCFVYGNTLYYMNNTNSLTDERTIKCSVDGLVHNIIKLSYPDQKFLIIDSETVVVREAGTICLLHTKKGSRIELCDGEIVGFCNNRLYYVYNTTLFEMDIIQRIEESIVVFDKLLASYYDGIIYEKDGATYSLLLETPSSPLLLTSEKIEWPDVGGWHQEFLYTTDRIIRITTNAVDVYSLNTGNIERIFFPELDRGILQMAATIHGDILYISIQRTDIKNWPIKDKDINGIYRYDFGTEEWTKVSSKTYGTIMQFDAKNLYGVNEYGLMNVGDVEKIPLG